MESGVYYVAGIDSGSTSTDVVILDKDGKIKYDHDHSHRTAAL